MYTGAEADGSDERQTSPVGITDRSGLKRVRDNTLVPCEQEPGSQMSGALRSAGCMDMMHETDS